MKKLTYLTLILLALPGVILGQSFFELSALSSIQISETIPSASLLGSGVGVYWQRLDETWSVLFPYISSLVNNSQTGSATNYGYQRRSKIQINDQNASNWQADTHYLIIEVDRGRTAYIYPPSFTMKASPGDTYYLGVKWTSGDDVYCNTYYDYECTSLAYSAPASPTPTPSATPAPTPLLSATASPTPTPAGYNAWGWIYDKANSFNSGNQTGGHNLRIRVLEGSESIDIRAGDILRITISGVAYDIALCTINADAIYYIGEDLKLYTDADRTLPVSTPTPAP